MNQEKFAYEAGNLIVHGNFRPGDRLLGFCCKTVDEREKALDRAKAAFAKHNREWTRQLPSPLPSEWINRLPGLYSLRVDGSFGFIVVVRGTELRRTLLRDLGRRPSFSTCVDSLSYGPH